VAGRRRVRSAREAAEQVKEAAGGEGVRTTPVATASRAVDYASQKTAQSEAERQMPDDLREALQRARDGDDSLLMPYQPSPSINPPRPRTKAYGYYAPQKTLFVRFRDGAVYAYYNVPSRVWNNFKRVKSPGRAINRTLNFYPYARLW